jgi:hypothetical protein
MPFVLKSQALWKQILLTTNFVTDVWKIPVTAPNHIEHIYVREGFVCLHYHTQKVFCLIFKDKNTNFKFLELFL